VFDNTALIRADACDSWALGSAHDLSESKPMLLGSVMICLDTS
jgi:hypothetical protein